jgi:hypothetical protein
MFDPDEKTLRVTGDESGTDDVGRGRGGGRGHGGRGRGRGRGGRGGYGWGPWGVYDDDYLDPYPAPVFLLPAAR